MASRIVPAAIVIAIAVLAAGGIQAAEAEPVTVKSNPLRDAYYGDLHLHTSYSLDAYLSGATRVDPDMAYRFARGDIVSFQGQPMQRREPLDFLAVTDHSENLGVLNELDNPVSALSQSDAGKELLAILEQMSTTDGSLDIELLVDQPDLATRLYVLQWDYAWGWKNRLPDNTRPVAQVAWARSIQFANDNYRPGTFTTFIAYEWTSALLGSNLHRNVIFRGDSAPMPFTSFDSRQPEALWEWQDTIRKQGFETLAIPHNSNASDGAMFAWLDSSTGYIDARYARQRQANEPLAEISQNKGASEVHPLLSPNDEFADFEIFDYMAGDRRTEGRAAGSYLRDALSRGLVLQREVGVNPFKYGFAGASDLHSGLSVSAQADYAGSYYKPNIAAGRPVTGDAADILADPPRRLEPSQETSSGSLTGVWAESNTRQSIFDAMRRRETFATSGTKLKLRFFGGWGINDSLLSDPDWVKTAYAQGVPMGGDLAVAPAPNAAPAFLVWALKDPNGGNLDRLQIVKVWEEDGSQKEQVFDIAWSGDRQPDPDTGKVQAVGNSVDLASGAYTNSIGAAELKAVWRDTEFDAQLYTAYYLRVLEIPTPRWTTLLATQAGLPLPTQVSATAQQRGWSSPIWYTP